VVAAGVSTCIVLCATRQSAHVPTSRQLLTTRPSFSDRHFPFTSHLETTWWRSGTPQPQYDALRQEARLLLAQILGRETVEHDREEDYDGCIAYFLR
jgi:hypothetical protein